MANKFISLIFCFMLFAFFLSGCVSEEENILNNAFEEASIKLATMNSELENSIINDELLIAANEKAYDENAIGKLEMAVSMAKSLKVAIPEKPKELESMKSEIEKINNTDYTSLLKQIADSKKLYEDSVNQLKQVIAPPEAFVIDRIQAIDGIMEISAVTEDNDPNNKLGKQGGYTAHIFFSYNLVNQADVSGNSIIDKGTDCGGSIEVYNTVEDAEKRNAYLSTYDGGMFASGSHKVMGTVVVRTSNLLKATQQKELEAKLIYSLINYKSSNQADKIYSSGECVYRISPTWKLALDNKEIKFFYPSGTTSPENGILMLQIQYLDVSNDSQYEVFDNYIQELRNDETNFEILEQNDIKITNLDGRHLILSAGVKEEEFEIESVMFLNNGIFYTFTAAHKEEIPTSFKDGFNNMVQSISFISSEKP